MVSFCNICLQELPHRLEKPVGGIIKCVLYWYLSSDLEGVSDMF